LTGLYEPSSGDAWVGGHSIKANIDKVQELIGYCPQFDLLWNDLSVEEHLYFYSRLKNVKSDSARIVFNRFKAECGKHVEKYKID
jgi:ABC-type multidrug transport system ATPase subunit